LTGSPFASLPLDEYEIANLREGLLMLRHIGCDTGDWLGQTLFKLPPIERLPNQTVEQQWGNVLRYNPAFAARMQALRLAGQTLETIGQWFLDRSDDARLEELIGPEFMQQIRSFERMGVEIQESMAE
jgi:hypothetical protein